MKAEKMSTERRRTAPNGVVAQHIQPAEIKAGRGRNGETRAAAPQNRSIGASSVKEGAAWVKQSSRREPDSKRAIAHYAATHLIEYGDVIQVGSGTTFNALMDKIIEGQLDKQNGLDLIILTSNLQVLSRASDAQSRDQSIFGTMQIILTGGALQMSLDSLIGEFAAEGVKTELIHPRTTFFGASGLSFRDGLTVRYQFEEEISTQVAYATRPTSRRVLLCDHTKFGRKTGWKAGLTLESLLLNTDTCLIISTLPEGNSKESVQWRKVIEQEEDELRVLLRSLLSGPAADTYADKEFALRLVDRRGKVIRQVALSELRNESISPNKK